MNTTPAALEHLPTGTLTAYARNSRTHSTAQIAQIAASIREYGFTNPVLIDEGNTIIAGHGRVLAAQQLALATVPCIRLGHLSDAQKRAYVIADNKLALNAGWDEDLLAAELQALQALDYDLDLLGFADHESTAILQRAATAGLSASELQAAELSTDSAPATDAAFQAEMADTTTRGIAPIVPMYAVHHQAFVIVCDNAIDEAWLRQRLRLEGPRKSYKDVKTQQANVLTVAQLREALA